MQELIGKWVGEKVSVTLQAGSLATGVSFEGKLLNVGDAGLLVELSKGQTFVPEHSILHVSLLHTK